VSLKFGFKTDVGLKRRGNQDSYVIVRGESLNGELDALFVVADGMGGKLGGEVASEIVVRTLPESIKASLAARNGTKAPIDTGKLLEEAIRAAQSSVRERQAADAQLSGMGTTCVAAILDANILTIANVGDSRAYLLREGRLTQITQDHSSVWEQVLAGQMTPDEARLSRFRNQITRAIGSEVNSEPDVDMVELKPGDSILLCSDGLSSELDDDEIARLFAGVADPQAACEMLVEAALGAGGRDNVTVIALRYGEFQPIILDKKPKAEPRLVEESMEAWREAGYDPISKRRSSTGGGEYRLGRGAGISPVLLGLLFVLAVLAGGETYALVRLNQEVTKLKKRPPEVVFRSPPRDTDKDLNYGEPVLFAAKPVRSAPLAVDDEVGVLAATSTGSIVRIDMKGQITPFPEQSKAALPLDSPAHELLLLATDASGNRYQVNPGAKSISKYDPEGNLKAENIGHGKLVAPTALEVDTLGNLYVIDEHRIKKIAAFESKQTPGSVPATR
jgi:serine/threonine protein phosphatase PrpC